MMPVLFVPKSPLYYLSSQVGSSGGAKVLKKTAKVARHSLSRQGLIKTTGAWHHISHTAVVKALLLFENMG